MAPPYVGSMSFGLTRSIYRNSWSYMVYTFAQKLRYGNPLQPMHLRSFDNVSYIIICIYGLKKSERPANYVKLCSEASGHCSTDVCGPGNRARLRVLI